MNWIKVEDQLPEPYDFVLVYANNQGTNEPKPISIARIVNQFGIWDFLGMGPNDSVGAYMDIEYGIESKDVTHWMKLPNKPSE